MNIRVNIIRIDKWIDLLPDSKKLDDSGVGLVTKSIDYMTERLISGMIDKSSLPSDGGQVFRFQPRPRQSH